MLDARMPGMLLGDGELEGHDEPGREDGAAPSGRPPWSPIRGQPRDGGWNPTPGLEKSHTPVGNAVLYAFHNREGLVRKNLQGSGA